MIARAKATRQYTLISSQIYSVMSNEQVIRA